MATLDKTPREVEKCRCLLHGLAKILADRLYGPTGPPAASAFSQLEHTADRLAGVLRKSFLDLLLARQAATFRDAPMPYPCPGCGRDTLAEDEPEPRLLHTPHGAVEWLEPKRYCPPCRKAFFPQSRSLGIDLGHYSTSLLDLIAYAGANKPSFREASQDLHKIGGIDVYDKQVERLCKRPGGERLAERDEQVAHFLALPLVERCALPQGVVAPDDNQVAVVMADAGMLQLRDVVEPAADQAGADTGGTAVACASAAENVPGNEDDEHDEDDADDDQDKAPPGRHWHEDKVGLVLTMRSSVCVNDPCPEIPASFLDPERVAKVVRGLKKSAPLPQDEQPPPGEAEESTPEQAEGEKAEYKGPQVEERRVVASRKSWPLFGSLLATAAWLAGFATAKRKAFVADGARAIWRVWRTRFSSYVPILDFIHALSYVYAAAKAVGADAVAGWLLYAEWIVWVWQGQVSLVIEKLQEWQNEHGEPAAAEAETSPRCRVAQVLRYLRNNRSKMKYDAYRQQGLPLVSSLVESMVKQISRRVKGTEKFWGEEGAEAILQLRADYLSDGAVMEGFWQRRQAAATGQRNYRTAADTSRRAPPPSSWAVSASASGLET